MGRHGGLTQVFQKGVGGNTRISQMVLMGLWDLESLKALV